jgi:putative ABC transport system ATP-binding protein
MMEPAMDGLEGSAGSPLAVRCRGVWKTYGSGDESVHALRGVDLEVRSGELMMLVGPSGCGKTTLISIIAGILDQDRGEVLVHGADVKAMKGGEKALHRGRTTGFVFQQYNLLPALTAAENAAVPLLVLGEKRKLAVQRAEAMLERVGLADRARSLPSQLSGGQQQRVAIARALVHEPRLVVCDEPTSALDQDTGRRVMELLREVAVAPGRALVIVTHDSRTYHFADRIARMNDGAIVGVDAPSAASR